MYGYIRLALAVIIVAALIFWIFRSAKKRNTRVKKPVLLVSFGFIMVVLLTLVLDGLPFENLFWGFDSPEAAFTYKYNNAQDCQVIEYDDCAFVIGSEYATVLTKRNDKWKLENVYLRRIKYVYEGYCLIKLWRVSNSNDYFVLVSGDVNDIFGETTDNIRDNRNSDFQNINDADNKCTLYKCTLVKDMDEDYVIYIDGKPVSVY